MCEALQVGFEAHTWRKHIRQVGPYPNSWKFTLDSGEYQAEGDAIYPFTAYQCARSLYICII